MTDIIFKLWKKKGKKEKKEKRRRRKGEKGEKRNTKWEELRQKNGKIYTPVFVLASAHCTNKSIDILSILSPLYEQVN